MTKRVETSHEKWRDWNWRSEGDIMVNGAYFIASGESLELKYEKAYSVEPKSAVLIDQLTVNAGVLGHRSTFFFPLSYFHFFIFYYYLCPFFSLLFLDYEKITTTKAFLWAFIN